MRVTANGRALGNSGGEGQKVQLLKIKPGVSPEHLEGTVKSNGRDEVAFRDAAGDLYVVQSRTLQQGLLGTIFPPSGSVIEVGALKGHALFVDKERSSGKIALTAAVLGATVAVFGCPLALASFVIGELVGGASATGAILLASGLGLATATWGIGADRRFRELQEAGDTRLDALVETRAALDSY